MAMIPRPLHPRRLRAVRCLRPPSRRHVSSTTNPPTPPPPKYSPRNKSPLRPVKWAFLVLGTWCGYIYATDSRAAVHQFVVPPLLRWVYPDAEDAHHATVGWLKTLFRFGLHPRERGGRDADGVLATKIFGYTLSNPIGISGGLDKDAEIPDPLFALGPAIVEVGGTTPLPQPGNPRPRLFRLPSQHALINRYGLNSQGAEHMAAVLRQRVVELASSTGLGTGPAAEQAVLDGAAGVPPGSLTEGKLLAVQIAKNKSTPDADLRAVAGDYVSCVEKLGRYADILVVNVSSPNTPGLRDLQRVEPLTQILEAVVQAAARVERASKPVVMVKVSPDEVSDEQVDGVCEAVRRAKIGGVIVGNTTKSRPILGPDSENSMSNLERNLLSETGGYSGPGLYDGTLELVRKYRTKLDGAAEGERKVIFACGGIADGEQAAKALRAGADVAMLYTGLVYGGSGTITRIKEQMKSIHDNDSDNDKR